MAKPGPVLEGSRKPAKKERYIAVRQNHRRLDFDFPLFPFFPPFFLSSRLLTFKILLDLHTRKRRGEEEREREIIRQTAPRIFSSQWEVNWRKRRGEEWSGVEGLEYGFVSGADATTKYLLYPGFQGRMPLCRT